MTTTDTSHVKRVSEDALDTLFRQARTANSFADEPVSDETLKELFELTELGPTAMNSLPMRVTFVKSPEARERLLPALSPGNREKTKTAPVTAIIAADSNFHQNLDRTFPHSPGAKDNFTDLAARKSFAEFNTSIQLGYFILAARSLGLVAGPMGGFNKDAVNQEFFAGTGLESVALVNLGLPGIDPWFPRNPRLTFDEAAQIL